MLWLPTLSVEVFRAAVPAVSVTAVPRLLAPSLNWTVPVGVPAPDETGCRGGRHGRGEGDGLAKDRWVRRGRQGRGARGLDRLAEHSRGARVEVGVTVVDSGDVVAAYAQRRGVQSG